MARCPNCGKEYNPGDEVCSDCGLVFPFTTDTLAQGTILQGRYEIQELAHSGGMGYIYLAKDKKLYDRLCIVKQVKEPVKSDSDLKKLEEEARRMAKLSHPNVAMILDHFVEDSHYFLVVERISGKTLSEVFEERHGQLTEEEVISWAIAMCDVISYIHKQAIIHRDISPDNVMITEEGNIKFVDFGTLRELRYITTKGTAGMGKYGYTPPEQWQGKPVPQSDIFALGATIYYLLTGSLPLSKEYLTGQGPQKADFSPSFPPIRTKNPDISAELEAILQKALELDVSNRYPSATKFGQALSNLKKVAVPRREIVEEAKPVLSIDCERLDFADTKPKGRATKSFTIKNVGTGKLIGSISGTQPWIKITPRTISLSDGGQKVFVTVDASSLVSGFKDIEYINIVTSGGNAKIMVRLSTSVMAKPAPVPVPRKRSNRKKLALFAAIGIAVLVPSLLIITLRANKVFNVQSDTSAPVISNIQVVSVTENSAVISWTTDERSTTFANFECPELGTSVVGSKDTNLVNDHKWEQASLEPGRWYVVTVYSTDANGNTAEEKLELTTLGHSVPPIAKVILSDDFSDPNSGWRATSSEDGESNYQNGGYHIILRKDYSCLFTSNDKVGQLVDFAFEVDAKWLSNLVSSQLGCTPVIGQKGLGEVGGVGH